MFFYLFKKLLLPSVIFKTVVPRNTFVKIQYIFIYVQSILLKYIFVLQIMNWFGFLINFIILFIYFYNALLQLFIIFNDMATLDYIQIICLWSRVFLQYISAIFQIKIEEFSYLRNYLWTNLLYCTRYPWCLLQWSNINYELRRGARFFNLRMCRGEEDSINQLGWISNLV